MGELVKGHFPQKQFDRNQELGLIDAAIQQEEGERTILRTYLRGVRQSAPPPVSIGEIALIGKEGVISVFNTPKEKPDLPDGA